MNITANSIDRTQLDNRMRMVSLTRDLESEVDSRYVLLGDELAGDGDTASLKELSPEAYVDPEQLGLVFWTWVTECEAIEKHGAAGSTYLNYIDAAAPPFGDVIPLCSGSEGGGDYVAFVIAYSELLSLLESCEQESAG